MVHGSWLMVHKNLPAWKAHPSLWVGRKALKMGKNVAIARFAPGIMGRDVIATQDGSGYLPKEG
jgi:hypothetical protein